ncbi:hypothetical protein IAI10_09540 [Clostridium sp. 19966]|uniref:hypothetical protein n=1 Tax=Clostridium sp. 19966 TaxID=2768166 RepID=UPI0028DEC2C2|nr:hypothetical protein [Clostridium sp. 19966]MDT8716899.1 hypothetical protein [Clostridium sp. 19966]
MDSLLNSNFDMDLLRAGRVTDRFEAARVKFWVSAVSSKEQPKKSSRSILEIRKEL